MSAEPERDFDADTHRRDAEAREAEVMRKRHEAMAHNSRRSVQMFIAVLAAITIFVASIPLYRRHRQKVRADRIAAIARREAAQISAPGVRPPLEIIFAEALPRWLIALQFRDQPERLGEIQAAFTALHDLASYDAAVLDRIERVHDLVDAGIVANGEAIVAIFRDWNNALDAAHVPYHLRPVLQASAQQVVFVVSAYRVIYDGHGSVGTRAVRIRLLRRIDHTNMREVLLGHVSDADEGAMILTDRIRDAAVSDFWPLFDNTPGRTVSPVIHAQQALVMRELRSALPSSAIATLTRLAPVYGETLATANAINARQSCSHFRLVLAPSHGMISQDLETMSEMLDTRGDDGGCPAVTEDELDTLIANAEQLSREPQLDTALESLAAFLTRAIAAHEARHAGDALETGSMMIPLPCNGCSAELSTAETAELSAYLASFATDATAYTSLYQACAAVGAQSGTHGTALTVAINALQYAGCGFPPPADLTARARAAEQAIFGRSEAIVLPAGVW